MIAELFPGLEKLTREQQVQLIDELWEKVANSDVAVSPDDPIYPMLEERMAEYRADPSKGSPWSEVRERLRKKTK